MTRPAAPAPFERVLDEHGPIVLALLRRLLGPIDADDAWQETFLSALRTYPGLRPDSDVRAWLLTIAHRKAIDRFRARGRHAVPTAELDVRTARAVVADSDGELWGRVRLLPDKQRLAVGYRFGADLSYRAIAELLGCSEPAARRSVFEGLRTLRSRMEEVPT